MRKLLPISLLFIGMNSFAQYTQSENYVVTKTYLSKPGDPIQKPPVETVQYFDGLGRSKQVVNVKASPLGNDIVTPIIYDGFGRQVQDHLPIPQSGSSDGGMYPQDPQSDPPVSNPVLPVIFPTETTFYSKKVLENSPLDRIRQQVQVGNAWSNRPVAFDYGTNHGTEVKKYTTTTTWSNNAGSSALTRSGNYGAAQLYKNTVTDEDGNATIDFRNGQGQTLLVRKNDGTRDSDTYYVYNEYDQLAFVISPEAAAKTTISQTDLDELCYQYRYDGRNRVVEKKLPGKGWEYMIYDKADRLAMSQDANLRLTGEWLFTKYDQFGRVLYTGIAPGGGSRSDMQGWVSDYSYTHEERSDTPFVHSGLSVYYTNNAIPGSVSNILSVNYYDTYPKGTPSLPGLILYQDAMPQTGILSTKGMPMASFVKNIEDDKWTKSYTVYDKKGRPIGHYSYNHLGGYTKTESFLDFTGVAQKTETRHKRLSSNTEVLIEENFTYDDQNRLLTHTHKVNGNAPVTLAQNEYNEIGQLVEKQVGGDQNGNNPLQTVNYAYNIRGWMRGINLDANNNPQTGKLFNYRIKYNDPENASVAPARYNGNIAEIDWWGDTGIRKRYGYQYDRLNRLLKGVYQDPDRTSPMTGINDESILYDLNGNITNLYRNTKHNSLYTAVMIDNLGYTYTGNRVTSISDATNNRSGYEGGGGTIGYDANGNMTSMPDKGISNISYNYLNLPTEIYQNDNVLEYHYRADGVKVKKMFTLNNDEGTSIINTEYLDGFQYSTPNTEPIRRAIESRDDTTVSAATAGEEEAFLPSDRLVVVDPGGPVIDDMILSFFPTAEGYYDYENFRYIYQYRDHLGNVRVSYVKDGNNLKIMDTNDYYPFGMSFLKPTVRTVYDPMAIPYNYKYNGKELQETGMYDYGWRQYMPDIGRWMQSDPLIKDLDFTFNPNEVDEDDEDEVEDAMVTTLGNGGGIFNPDNLNPYSYGYNNPVKFDDPDGRCPLCIVLVLVGYGILDAPSRNVSANQTAKQSMTDSRDKGLVRALTGGAGSVVMGAVGDAGGDPTLRGMGTPSRGSTTKTGGSSTEKKVPNPNGKNGGEAHQKTIKNVEKQLKKEGFNKIEKEVMVKTPNGEKSKRFIDVRGTNTKTGAVKDVQVGKQNKNGTPVSRERKAIKDIQDVTKRKVDFKPYN